MEDRKKVAKEKLVERNEKRERSVQTVLEGGDYSLNYHLPETRYAPTKPKLHHPKHSLASNVFFFFFCSSPAEKLHGLLAFLSAAGQIKRPSQPPNPHVSSPFVSCHRHRQQRRNNLFFFGHLLHAHGNAFRFCLSSSSQLIMHIPARALDCISARLVQ